MRRVNRLYVLLLALFLASPVQAGMYDSPSSARFAPYVGVGAGGFRTAATIPGSGADSAYGFGAFVRMGYEFNDFLAVELRVGAVEQTSLFNQSVGIRTDSFVSELIKINLPISDDMRFYGLLGATSAVSNPSGALTGSARATSSTFGGGVQILLSPQFEVGAEWVRYWHQVDVGDGVDITLDGLSGHLSFLF